MGCASGPVQKVEQHFERCHGLPVKSAANYRLRKHKRAPTREAIEFKLPNPYARHTIGSGHSIELHEAAGPSRRPQQVRLDSMVRPKATAEVGSKGEKGSGGFKGDGRKGKGRAGNAGSGGTKGKGMVPGSGGRKGKEGAGRRTAFVRDDTPSESEEDMGEGGVGPGSEHDSCDGEAFLRAFKLFLLSPLGGSRNRKTASQIEANTRKYLTHVDMDPRRLVEVTPIQPFVTEVQEGGVGCSGVLQRLDAHSLALKYYNFTNDEESLPGKVQRTLDFLRTLRRSYKAQKVAKERESIESKAYNPPDLSGLDNFLTDESIREEFVKTAEDILVNPDPSKKQYNTCLAIVAGRVLYSNAQRPGAVTGALLSEYEEGFRARKKGESYVTIRVRNHKTGSSESAKLVIPRKTLKLLAVWEEVRSKVAEKSPYLFPDFKGGQLNHLTRVVTRFAEDRHISLPNVQSVCTSVELKAKHMAAPVQEAVSRSLSHGHATVLKHYMANDKESGYLAYETIQNIVSGDKGDADEPEASGLGKASPKKPKRKAYTQEENEIVKAYFASYIRSKELPLKADSQRFLDGQPEHLFQGRKPHDVYDKVRNLIGRK